jgi:hypothetical protein
MALSLQTSGGSNCHVFGLSWLCGTYELRGYFDTTYLDGVAVRLPRC